MSKPTIEPELSKADSTELSRLFPEEKKANRKSVRVKRLVLWVVVLLGFALDFEAVFSQGRVFFSGSILALLFSDPLQFLQSTVSAIPLAFSESFSFLPGLDPYTTVFLRFLVPASLAIAVTVRAIPGVAKIVHPQDEVKLESMIEAKIPLSWPKPKSSEMLRREFQKE